MSPRYIRSVTVAAFGALLAASAFGQSKGSGAPPAGSTGNAGSTTGSTGRGTGNNIPSNNNPNNPTAPTITQPIFLSGKVMIDDGSALTEPATIVRVCNGNPRNEGYTDSRGNFSIQLGNELGVLQDADEPFGGGLQTSGAGRQGMGGMQTSGSTSGGSGMDRRLINCELQAKVSGFRSQSVMLATVQPMDGPVNVGTILLHRYSKTEEGNTVSATSLAAPKNARKAFEKGLALTKKDKQDDAFREYQKAVMLYPAYATAWCELGKIEAARGQFDIARGSFQKAEDSDPKYVDPYLELSRMALHDQNWPQLAQFTGKAIELDSFDYPQEFLFDALARYNLHEFDHAKKSILRAEILDTRRQFPQIAYLKGLVLVQEKEYTAAAESLRAYLKLAPNAEDAATVRDQLAQLEKYLSQSAAKQP